MIQIKNSDIVFTKGDTLSLKVDVVDAEDAPFDPQGKQFYLALALYQVAYIPKEGIQDIHNVTCTLPHEELTIKYKKILTPYHNYTSTTPLVVGSESTYGTIVVSANDTDTWDMDEYEYRLQLCTEDDNKEIYTIVNGTFSVV